VSHHDKTAWPQPWKDSAPWPRQPVAADLRWQHDAACREVDEEISERLVEADRPHEVADLVAALCLRCPVARACLQAGQEMRADGTWGGVVLRDGSPARADTPRVDTVA
jgi:WhiB family redox-sensing transcriptional regulator